MSFEPWPFKGLHVAAQEKLGESKLGPLEVSPQLLLALEEDELETVADKTAITWSFLAVDAGSSSFNRQVKRGRQRLNEFGNLRKGSQQPDLQTMVQNLSEDPLGAHEILPIRCDRTLCPRNCGKLRSTPRL